MDIEAKIADIQKMGSEAVSRMQKSIIEETCNNVDENSETSEEVDVINMDQPILDNSSSTSRIGEEPALGINPYRFGSIANLELQVLKMDKRRRGQEFEEEAKLLQSSKRLDQTYTFNPAQVEQARRLPLHPISTIGW
jgi:hypothetical protein